MKLKKGFILFLLLISEFVLGQGVSVLPSYLPENLYGSWVDGENNVSLIVSENYIVIQNELFYYNDIVKENEIINFTCVDGFNVKYITISTIDSASISLDEGYQITKLTKILKNTENKLPKTLIGNWFDSKTKIELLEKKILFSESSYVIDYFISTNNINYYFVLYRDGGYYFLYNYVNDNGHFLNTNFDKNVIFKKESFFHKHRIVFISVFIIALFVLGYCLFKWRVTLAKKRETTKRLFVEMQLKSIRSQMNPHFLFNALSAIQNLINKGDNEKANHYLTEFSQLMRLTLDKSEKGLVPLHEEIESIKKYLELEGLRFPFKYSIIVDSKINKHDVEIPAMLIQPFVENAIVHGLNEKKGEKKLTIDFKIEKGSLRCFIVDEGIGINAAQAKKRSNLNREKYGIKLAQDRIGLINENYKTNAKIKITDASILDSEKTGTMVEISMPLSY
ncbi:MAG: histidine kinase [Algibacter sp.]